MIRTAAPAQGLQALTVSIDGEWLAIDATDVAEVIRQPTVTRVPLSPPSLVGVSNLRGSVVPILSLAVLCGKQQGGARSSKVVIVDRGDPVGLLVDDVSALKRVDDLRNGSGAMPFLDLEALVVSEFGSLVRPKAAVGFAPVGAPSRTAVTMDAGLSFFGFQIAGQEFALPLENVREVLARPDSLSLVPHTDEEMLGVIPLREHLLPVVSLPALLGLGEAKIGDGRVVVARIGEAHVGLVVDGVTTIIRAAAKEIDPVPMVLTRGSQEAQIQGICRVDGGKRLVSILSVNHLLKDGLAERLLRDQERKADHMSEATRGGDAEKFLIFQIGEEDFGLPVACISEVVAPPEKLTRLPKAPAFVEGVMNLRGEVVPLIDQRRRFQTARDAKSRKPRVIVLRVGNGIAGFIVDAVTEVLSVASDQVRTSPQMASSQSKVVERIANLESDGRMILLINPQELLDRAEQDILAAMHEAALAPA